MTELHTQKVWVEGKRPSWFCAFQFAFQGVVYAIATERNMRFHVSAAALVALFNLVVRPSIGPVALSSTMCALVMASELWNTGLERLADKLSQGKSDEVIGVIKDVGAGAVLLTACGAVFVACYLVISTYPWHFKLFSMDDAAGAVLSFLMFALLLVVSGYGWRMNRQYRR